jgi:hypothetical protein
MVLGRGFLYCVYDAKNIIHIIQRRQHGLDGTGGKTLPYLSLLPLKKQPHEIKILLPFMKVKSILCVSSLMCFYYYFPFLKQTITILPAYDLA